MTLLLLLLFIFGGAIVYFPCVSSLQVPAPTTLSNNPFFAPPELSQVLTEKKKVMAGTNEQLILNSRNAWLDLFNNKGGLESDSTYSGSGNFSSSLKNRLVPDVGAWKSVTILNDPGSLRSYLSGSYILEEDHAQEVKKLWRKLSKGSLKRFDEVDSIRINEALKICYIGLWGRRTARSQEPLCDRAQGVAQVLGELGVDVHVVLAGMLHEVTLILNNEGQHDLISQLASRFGNDVIDLAEKYSRIPKLMARTSNYTLEQSENQLQMLVIKTEDFSCFHIRIADRVLAMRRLKDLPLEEDVRMQIALEALYLYAPLAHKLGMGRQKGELEDLSFSITHPKMFIKAKHTKIRAEKAFQDACALVDDITKNDPVLKEMNAHIKVTHRVKDRYQLYMKMKRKGLNSMDDVRDALGLRIIVSPNRVAGETEEMMELRGVNLCYYLIERLRNARGWEPAPNGFKDYIADKKANGYQSLHQYIRSTSLLTNVEVQVRTVAMHRKAEHGEAAHWHYKDLLYRQEIANSKLYRVAWRSDAQMHAKSPMEVFNLAKEQILRSRVLVFLEDLSTVVNMRKDASALDAAFYVHSKIGLSASLIRINGKLVSFDHPLSNGDVIAVHCQSDAAIPLTSKISWLSVVKTSHALQTIRKDLRDFHPGSLAFMGLVHLLSVIMLNKDLIIERHDGATLDAQRLIKLSKDRLGLSFGSFLTLLGNSHSREDILWSTSRLFGLPANKLKVEPFNFSILWARMQSENSWDDSDMNSLILLPLLNTFLPAQGLENVKVIWRGIIGDGPTTTENLQLLPGDSLSSSYSSATKQKKVQRILPKDLLRSSNMFPNGTKVSAGDYVRTLRPVLKPFSLEASSLSENWLKLAKQSYAAKLIEKNKRSTIFVQQ